MHTVFLNRESPTSPGTGGCGYGGSALHGRDEGWLEVKQVAGEVWHAVRGEGQQTRVNYDKNKRTSDYCISYKQKRLSFILTWTEYQICA